MEENCPVKLKQLDEKFGHKMKIHFMQCPVYVNVNCGSFGIVPKIVHQAKVKKMEYRELNPDRWVRYKLEEEVKKTKLQFKKYINAESIDDFTFLDSCAFSFNSIMGSKEIFDWNDGDVIMSQNIDYKMIHNTIEHFTNQNPTIKNVKVGLKKFHLQNKEIFLNRWKEAVEQQQEQGNNIKVAVLYHISAEPAILYPLKELIQYLHSQNIMVIVDGAHACGQVKIDVQDLDADFYFSNISKWGFAPKACGFLWINRKKFEERIHPNIISLYYGQGWVREFYYVGSRDQTSYLAIGDAVNFRASFGEDDILKYNHNLCKKLAKRVSEMWSTKPLNENLSMLACMVDIELPSQDKEIANYVFKKLYEEYEITLPIHQYEGVFYARFSAQIINELSDYEFVAEKVLKYCQ